ncbi:MAG: hypothetical protein ACM3X4_11220 [Ignavibacteriales bacterium]
MRLRTTLTPFQVTLIAALVVPTVVALALATSSSWLYMGEGKQYQELVRYEGQRDITSINYPMLRTRSPEIKMIALAYIEDFLDDSSIPALVKMLSYDLAWYYFLDENLYPKPISIRFSAFQVLVSYGPERAGWAVMPLLSSENVYDRLYGAAIVLR